MPIPKIVSMIGWQWKKHYVTPEVMIKPGNLLTISNLKIIDPGPLGDVTKYPQNDCVLITGDGETGALQPLREQLAQEAPGPFATDLAAAIAELEDLVQRNRRPMMRQLPMPDLVWAGR